MYNGCAARKVMSLSIKEKPAFAAEAVWRSVGRYERQRPMNHKRFAVYIFRGQKLPKPLSITSVTCVYIYVYMYICECVSFPFCRWCVCRLCLCMYVSLGQL